MANFSHNHFARLADQLVGVFVAIGLVVVALATLHVLLVVVVGTKLIQLMVNAVNAHLAAPQMIPSL
jgi:hypothetical protein